MARSVIEIRKKFHEQLDRLVDLRKKITAATGNGQTFTFPEQSRLCEGMFLSAWTRWESSLRELFIVDLATIPNGCLRYDVKATGFRLKGSPYRLAEAIVDHPDDHRFVEWSALDDINARADALLGSGHRYGQINTARKTTIQQMKKVRNAVAHNSDSAWSKFKDLIGKPPYSLTNQQMKGITVGRFLGSHQVNGVFIIDHFVDTLRQSASDLVP